MSTADKERAVDLHIVHVDEVLVIVAASHIVLRTELVIGTDAWQGLQQRLYASTCRGDDERHLRVYALHGVLAVRLIVDDHLVHNVVLHFQYAVQGAHLSGLHFHLIALPVKSDVREGQLYHFLGWNSYAVAPKAVGLYSIGGSHDGHTCIRDGPSLFIFQGALQSAFLLCNASQGNTQQENQRNDKTHILYACCLWLKADS